MTEKENNYNASSIQYLEPLELVRRRPGMYIGNTGKEGLHHLVWEILDNSVDEVINGHANEIHVILDKDRKGITITDNGRGIPVDIHPELGIPGVIVAFTKIGAGAKFGPKS